MLSTNLYFSSKFNAHSLCRESADYQCKFTPIATSYAHIPIFLSLCGPHQEHQMHYYLSKITLTHFYKRYDQLSTVQAMLCFLDWSLFMAYDCEGGHSWQ